MPGSNGAFDWRYTRWERGVPAPVDGVIIHEEQVRIHVNGIELVSFMCTPKDLDLLALGFLRSEGIIQGIADVRLLHTCPSETCIEVWLRDPEPVLPQRAIVTSGCGGGVTFDDLSQRVPPVESAVTLHGEPGQRQHAPVGERCNTLPANARRTHVGVERRHADHRPGRGCGPAQHD